MDYQEICEAKMAELRQKEAELYVAATARYHHLYGSNCDCLAWALVSVMRLYEDVFRDLHYGGLVSTKHIYDTRVRLAQEIGLRYNVSQVKDFVDFCLAYSQGQSSLSDVEDNTRKMLTELLCMRPDPKILPRESYWKRVWEGED